MHVDLSAQHSAWVSRWCGQLQPALHYNERNYLMYKSELLHQNEWDRSIDKEIFSILILKLHLKATPFSTHLLKRYIMTSTVKS